MLPQGSATQIAPAPQSAELVQLPLPTDMGGRQAVVPSTVWMQKQFGSSQYWMLGCPAGHVVATGQAPVATVWQVPCEQESPASQSVSAQHSTQVRPPHRSGASGGQHSLLLAPCRVVGLPRRGVQAARPAPQLPRRPASSGPSAGWRHRRASWSDRRSGADPKQIPPEQANGHDRGRPRQDGVVVCSLDPRACRQTHNHSRIVAIVTIAR